MTISPSERLALPAPSPNTLALPPKTQTALAIYNPPPDLDVSVGLKPQKYSEVDIYGLIKTLKNPPEQVVDLYIHYCPRIKSDNDNCSVSLTLADDKFVRRILYRFAGPTRTESGDHETCSQVIATLADCPTITSVTLEIDYVQSDMIVQELCTVLQTNRSLQKLSVYSDNRFQQPLNSECVKHISEMLLVNTGIKELQLGLIDINLNVADHLALALRRNRTLRALTLYARIEADAMLVLMKPFSGQESNQTLRKFDIKGFRCVGPRGIGQVGNKGAEHVASIICRNSFLEEVSLKNCEIDSLGVQTLALALLTNKNLKLLDLSYNPLDTEGLKELVKTITPDATTKEQPNSSLKKLIIRHSFIGRQGAPILANMLQTNSTLVRLDLQCSVRLWQPRDVILVLNSLRNNSSLKSLDLRGCEGVAGEKVLATILDLLVANPWLEELGVEGTPLSRKGHDAVVKAQLRRNAEKFLEVLKGMGSATPKAARVFLCGIPFAGKTTFRKTMVYSSIKRTTTSMRVKTQIACKEAIAKNKLFSGKESQTIGIEVQVIVEDNIQISIWDLAGHEEFHAFHDLVVPNLSTQGSACSFVLLCDISISRRDGRKFELKDLSVIDQELRYWLRFIASNTRQSINLLPHVTVIFTHSDKFPKVDLVGYVKSTVENLRNQFSKVINITEFHVADARSRKSIEPVTRAVQKRIFNILDRVPKVFEAYTQMQSNLTEWKMQHPDKPLIKWTDFSLLCAKVPALRRLQGQDAKVAEDRQKAVAKAMHDAGELLFFDGLDFMVVDPNWFCHDIMGRILSIESSLLVLKHPLIDSKGLAKRENLKKVLEASLCKNKNPIFKGRKVRGVVPEDLVQLMIKLNLGFEQNPSEKNSGIVIPATLKILSEEATKGERPLSWPLGLDPAMPDDFIYMGWRLECEDPFRTCLTVGFFPRLQVFLQKKFASVSDAQYTIEKNFISFVFSGLEFLIEYNNHTECQIDLLVRSTNENVETWSTVEECVLVPTRQFCASPIEGCQGVVLIEGVLRPQCVRELWVYKERKDQCVGVEKLKQRVLATGNLDYEHRWKKGLSGFPPESADQAKDLLGPENWEDVLNRYMDALEKLDDEVNPKVSLGGRTPGRGPSRIPRAVSLLPRPSEMTGRLIETRLLHRVDDIDSLQKKLYRELSKNLNRVISYPPLLQDRKVPRIVYWTSEEPVKGERLVTKLQVGVGSRQLHLMCEHQDGIHKIDNQIGSNMGCDGKAVRSARPHMVWGLKVISTLMKIGEQAAKGFGSIVPQSERVMLMGLGGSQENGKSGEIDEKLDLSGEIEFTMEEKMAAEKWLINFLKGKNLSTLFGLYNVEYLDDGEPTKEVAWVCEKHRNYGLHLGTMQALPA